ncbi:MAG: malto-oligosyltrehalose synthase [Pirellulaceae bacterium]|nr:malto-oligosyltrehalose synthase [Pirellulaceae bacterium]
MDDAASPISTYRLQLNPEFGFEQARDLVPYLSRLGATHVYCSPILRPRPGSTHGYDVIDPSTLNPQLGDEAQLRLLVSALQAHGMGLILDIVPNHMAACHENVYWSQVLTYGPSSPHARWFDIDWRLPDPESWGRVLVPVLGQPLPKVLEDGQLRIVWESGRFEVRYFEHVFPLDPATVPMVCRFGLDALSEVLAPDHPTVADIRRVLDLLATLPRRARRVRRRFNLPLDEVETWLGQLAQRIEMLPQVHDWAVRTAEQFGAGETGQRRLKKLLDAQSYRLVYWRQAARAINYRRFFDINDLIALRQEDPEVFQETHALVGRWIREGLLNGLRVDHLDGLRDPAGYLRRLAELGTNGERPVAIFVEKILAPGEHLPRDWPVRGTTGYEFLNEVEALFIHPDGYEELEDFYLQVIGRPVRFKNVAAWGKRRVLREELSAFVGRLADLLTRLAQQAEPTSRLTEQQLVDAIVEFAVGLPVYRTYIDAEGTMSAADRAYLLEAFRKARQALRASEDALAFLERVLLLDEDDVLHGLYRPQCLNFVQRLQQLTGPATAKGIEDTALYAFVPLASRNEVGGEPVAPLETAAEDLHRENLHRSRHAPGGMLCVTTHDTKRNADVRARLDVLSEIPKLWVGYVKRWQRLNRPHRTQVGGKAAPEPAAECLFYQNLVGIWPAPERDDQPLPDAATLQQLRSRLEQYMLKAAREAKTRTSWVKVNSAYEEALIAFVRSVFVTADPDAAAFLNDVQQLVGRIADAGCWNSLSRCLIQLTAPGVPDIYQGDELWNLALVDPDNRSPVDFDVRRQLLDDVARAVEDPEPLQRRAYLRQLLENRFDGRLKLHVLRSALLLRRECPDLFVRGDYQPLVATGHAAGHVFCFARTAGSQTVAVVVPRFTRSLAAAPTSFPLGPDVWRETAVQLPAALQGHNWLNVLTREPVNKPGPGRLPVAAALDVLPVALLLSQ